MRLISLFRSAFAVFVIALIATSAAACNDEADDDE